MGDLEQGRFAPIQLTISWDGHRLREATGELTRPEWWDSTNRCVRAVKGSYYANINGRLTELKQAVEKAQQAADDRHERLSAAAMQQVLRAVRQPADASAQVESTQATPALAGKSVPALFKLWIDEQAAKVSKKTGRPRARTTLSNLNGTYEKLRAFEQVRGQALALPEMDLQRFYQPFWLWFTQDPRPGHQYLWQAHLPHPHLYGVVRRLRNPGKPPV